MHDNLSKQKIDVVCRHYEITIDGTFVQLLEGHELHSDPEALSEYAKLFA